MRSVYAHFPINCNVTDEGTKIEIRNFLGEKFVRRVDMREGVSVKPSGKQKDELILDGNDIEQVSLSGTFRKTVYFRTSKGLDASERIFCTKSSLQMELCWLRSFALCRHCVWCVRFLIVTPLLRVSVPMAFTTLRQFTLRAANEKLKLCLLPSCDFQQSLLLVKSRAKHSHIGFKLTFSSEKFICRTKK